MILYFTAYDNAIRHRNYGQMMQGPEYVRPSIGTLGALGLRRMNMAAMPTTAYIMVGDRCSSNCAFCTQRRENPENERLSRVTWPRYPTEEIIRALKDGNDIFSRICFQTLDYGEVVEDTLYLSEKLNGIAPVSVSMVPISKARMLELRDAGVEHLSIALDAANPDIFEKIRGKTVGNRFTWEGNRRALRDSVEVFGKGNTHLIVGLGESDEDLIGTMIKLRDTGIYTALFAYTPVNGGSAPSTGRYRAIQLSHALIYREGFDSFEFEKGKISATYAPTETLEKAAKSAFLTSGCPGCNRPFYNEKPGDRFLYNYPYPVSEDTAKTGLKMAMDYIHSSQD